MKKIIFIATVFLFSMPLMASALSARTITNPATNAPLNSAIMRNELQLLENEIVSGTSTSLTKGNFLVGSDAGATQATSSIFVSSLGRIGIGTTTPGTKLDVNGVFRVASSTFVAPTRGSGLEFSFREDGNGYITSFDRETSAYKSLSFSGSSFGANTDGTGVNNFVVNTIGNVGIASTTPWGLLSINPTAVNKGPSFVVGSSTNALFIITSSGIVGIGTSSPTSRARLAIGDVDNSGTDAAGIVFYGNQAAANGTGYSGIVSEPVNTGSGTLTTLNGIFTLAQNTTATTSNLVGANILSANVGSGTTTQMFGTFATTYNTAGGYVQQMQPLYSDCQATGNGNAGGNVGACIGLYLDWEPTQVSKFAAMYGIYQTNPNGANWLNAKTGIGTSSPTALLAVATPNSADGLLKTLFVVASSTLTSTSTMFSVSNVGSVNIGTTTPTFAPSNGLLTIGSNGTSGTTTISVGKLQWDGYNSAGARTCMYVVGTTMTVKAGACIP